VEHQQFKATGKIEPRPAIAQTGSYNPVAQQAGGNFRLRRSEFEVRFFGPVFP
jgi:hypothetical protein